MTPNDLITNHIPLVRSIASRFDSPHLRDDLIGEGMIALIKCADKFDPDHGVTFGQFAKVGIRRAMIKYLKRNTNDTVSLDDRDEDGVPYHAAIGGDGQIGLAMLKDDLGYYLHPVEEWVVVKRYLENVKMEDIAAEMGFAFSRTSQIHTNAIGKLRKAFGNAEDVPREESDGRDQPAALLQVVKKMMWDEWGVEVEL